MRARALGALLTGPVAFFVAGLIDVFAVLVWGLRCRLRRRAVSPRR